MLRMAWGGLQPGPQGSVGWCCGAGGGYGAAAGASLTHFLLTPQKHSDDFDVVALWLANACRLLNCLRQYGRDEVGCWGGGCYSPPSPQNDIRSFGLCLWAGAAPHVVHVLGRSCPLLPLGGLWGGVTWEPVTLTWLYLQSCHQGNTAHQNEHRLRNLDPQGPCHSLGALAVQLYQQLVRTAEKRLKPMIGRMELGGMWGWGLMGCLVVEGSGAVGWLGLAFS